VKIFSNLLGYVSNEKILFDKSFWQHNFLFTAILRHFIVFEKRQCCVSCLIRFFNHHLYLHVIFMAKEEEILMTRAHFLILVFTMNQNLKWQMMQESFSFHTKPGGREDKKSLTLMTLILIIWLFFYADTAHL